MIANLKWRIPSYPYVLSHCLQVGEDAFTTLAGYSYARFCGEIRPDESKPAQVFPQAIGIIEGRLACPAGCASSQQEIRWRCRQERDGGFRVGQKQDEMGSEGGNRIQKIDGNK